MVSGPVGSGDTVRIESAVLGQLAYHIRFAAGLAAEGRGEESVPHAVLSWALLRSVGGDALREAMANLDLPDRIGAENAVVADNVRKPTQELALQLCAHFTSVGHNELSQLYHDTYRTLTKD
jgi:hypothetical protein